MATVAPRSFAFVSADDFGTLRANDRKLVRSHCMRGKNKKKSAHALASERPLGRHGFTPGRQPLSFSLPDPAPSKSFLPREALRWDAWMIGDKPGNARELREAARKEPIDPIPSPVDLSLVKFASEVDNYSLELLFKCLLEHSYPCSCSSSPQG